MRHAGADVHHYVPTGFDVGGDAGESTDDGTRPELHVTSDAGPGVDEGRRSPAAGAGVPVDAGPGGRVGEADQVVGVEPIEQVESTEERGSAPGEWIRVHAVVIDEAEDVVAGTLGGRVDRLHQIEQFPAVPSRAHDDQRAQVSGHAATVAPDLDEFNLTLRVVDWTFWMAWCRSS